MWLHFQVHLENAAPLCSYGDGNTLQVTHHQRYSCFPSYTLHSLETMKSSNKSFPIRRNKSSLLHCTVGGKPGNADTASLCAVEILPKQDLQGKDLCTLASY